MTKATLLIIFFLVIGVIYRLVLTSNNNFLFNMDNARDMVDVREMVVLGKMRLIGNTAAIEGVYYGPFWYYLLTIPFVLTGGSPYAEIIMQIILWVIGGYFALKLASRFGLLSQISVGCLWVASNFVVLSTTYAFNPNPTLFLTPLFLYLFEKFLKTKKTIYSVSSFALAGTFFSTEIFFAIFMPVIIILTIVVTDKNILKTRSFWFGVIAFLLIISPQIFFDLRHQFLMSKSLINYVSGKTSGEQVTDPIKRIILVWNSFYTVMSATFMNFLFLIKAIGLFTIISLVSFFIRRKLKEKLLEVLLIFYITIPMIGFTILTANISSWHWVGVAAALIIFAGFVIGRVEKINLAGKVLSLGLTIILVALTISNISDYIKATKVLSHDPSQFGNELAAVDYVYKKAEGKNFKVYVYLPSVIDYPYQYLFWWRGLKKYGYMPQDYAYAPNKPEYIKSKEKLDKGTHPQSSSLVFLIKEQNRDDLRDLWENTYTKYPLMLSEKVGPLVVETRQDISEQ